MKFNTKQAKNPIELNIEFDNGAQYCRSEIKLGKDFNEFAICMRNAITR